MWKKDEKILEKLNCSWICGPTPTLKIINLPQGRYTKPKLFNYKDLLYISITDEKENKIYLFNNEGDMINGFPLKGTNIVDIVDSDNDGKIELISQLDNNSVISYEIN